MDSQWHRIRSVTLRAVWSVSRGLMTRAVQDMAKKPGEQPKEKAHGGARAGAGRKPQPPERVRKAVTMIRSADEWKEAVEQLAEWDRASSISELIDRAVVAYARARGYDRPIPKR